MSTTQIPATLGSIARRRGGEARAKRTPITAAVPRQEKTIARPNPPANRSAMPGSACSSRKLPSRDEEEVARHLEDGLRHRRAHQDPVGRRRQPPALRKVRSSAIIGIAQASSSRSPNRRSVGASTCANTGSTSSPKPVATISAPV